MEAAQGRQILVQDKRENLKKKNPEKYPTMIMLPAEELCALWVTKGREAQETLTGCTAIGTTISSVLVIIILSACR